MAPVPKHRAHQEFELIQEEHQVMDDEHHGVKELTDADLKLTEDQKLLIKPAQPLWKSTPADLTGVDDYMLLDDVVIDWNCHGNETLRRSPLLLRSPLLDS